MTVSHFSESLMLIIKKGRGRMSEIKEKAIQELGKIKVKLMEDGEDLKKVADEKKQILDAEAEADIHRGKLHAEAVHLKEVHEMKKEVEKETKEFKKLLHV